MQTILHWPAEGPLLQQPAKIVFFFELIEFLLQEKADREEQKEKNESARQGFHQRQKQKNSGKIYT